MLLLLHWSSSNDSQPFKSIEPIWLFWQANEVSLAQFATLSIEMQLLEMQTVSMLVLPLKSTDVIFPVLSPNVVAISVLRLGIDSMPSNDETFLVSMLMASIYSASFMVSSMSPFKSYSLSRYSRKVSSGIYTVSLSSRKSMGRITE